MMSLIVSIWFLIIGNLGVLALLTVSIHDKKRLGEPFYIPEILFFITLWLGITYVIGIPLWCYLGIM